MERHEINDQYLVINNCLEDLILHHIVEEIFSVYTFVTAEEYPAYYFIYRLIVYYPYPGYQIGNQIYMNRLSYYCAVSKIIKIEKLSIFDLLKILKKTKRNA